MTHTADFALAGGATRDASLERVTFEIIPTAAAWDTLMSRAAFPHSVQAFAYGEAKANNGWSVTRVLVRHADQPVAMVQALEKRILGIRLVTRINRGPMFFDAHPPREMAIAVYRAIRNRWGRMPFGVLLIAPALEEGTESQQIMARAGYRPRRGNGWGSARIDLRPDIDTVFATLDGKWRNRVRAGQRNGVSVRATRDEAEFEWMQERHLENMRSKDFRGHDHDFLRALRRSFGDDLLLVQAMHEDKPVAGLMVVKTGTLADGVVAWFGPEARDLKAGNVLAWGAIEEMHKLGCESYDVGGTNSDRGFSTFKAGMNGESYILLGEHVSF